VAARQLGPIDRALLQGFISSLVEEWIQLPKALY
jgi:hypothetical protein